MSTSQIQTLDKKSKLSLVLTILFVLLGLFMTFLQLSEFYNVRLGVQESAYAFGAGDSVDRWLYQSASHYSNYMLASGFLFLTLSAIALWSMIRKRKLVLFMSMFLIVLLFFVDRIICSFI